MRIFRGDTFEFDFSAKLTNNTNYVFQTGDVLKAGLKNSISESEYMLYKKITIPDDTETVTFSFSHVETKNLIPKNDCILEVELTDTQGKVMTLYQNTIEIEGDVVNE